MYCSKYSFASGYDSPISREHKSTTDALPAVVASRLLPISICLSLRLRCCLDSTVQATTYARTQQHSTLDSNFEAVPSGLYPMERHCIILLPASRDSVCVEPRWDLYMCRLETGPE